MLEKQEREQIIALINREVVPAIGCTEPMAVSLCVAKAAEALGVRPARIDVLLSSNILKNAMGVGIPGTGMVGLPIAIALGALIGRSEYELEVLRDVTPDAVEQGRQYMSEKRISIGLKKDFVKSHHRARPQSLRLYLKDHRWPRDNSAQHATIARP